MQILSDIKNILHQARQKAYQSINLAMVQAYWLIGKRIVEEDQQGEARAVYGKALLKNLSAQLQNEFGKGFSERNLEQMRAFYLNYSISQTASAKSQIVVGNTPNFQLSWSHYLMLIAIKDPNERAFYENLPF
ncbi:DUF1016 N-terminal domain-containing protein [Runella sp.]|jgi:hypothetical protein|uniref:DUF1016 N-terminal domain-containing protein n=1 Tax=Runella sp. TaxID=1960881 RepID=UPI00260ED2DE|nr:DUF1016 N-terminal domain-containing protein [Runella sp.]